MTEAKSSGPLDGIRILDLTSVVMGPYATHILADLGADVIKVEAPDGDLMRYVDQHRNPGMGGGFLQINRNKRSIVLDLKRPPAKRALERLIEQADVFLHAIRPQAIARLGFDYASVAALNPDIVYCGAYGYSTDGPYGHKAAYDDVIQAASGLAALHARLGDAPAYVPTVMCDKLCGQAIAYSVLAALLARERGGGGQAVEVPMFETSIEFLAPEHINGASFEPPLGRFGYPRVLSKWRRPLRTADGYACIMPYSTRNWRDFLGFIGRADLKDDPRFGTVPDRARHIDALYELLTEAATERTTAEWIAFGDRVGIPCMAVMEFEDLYEDPHVKAVGLFQIVEHPTEGAQRAIRRPVNFKGSPFEIRRHAPALGQHTGEVLREAGLTEEEIAELGDTA